MQMQRKQQGFTLIELVAVIVVLGILASVAMPKFFGLQAEARAAAVNGAKSNLASAATMAHAKMLATNQMPAIFDGIGPISWSAHNPDGPSAGLIAGLNQVSGTGGMMAVTAVAISDWNVLQGPATFGTSTMGMTTMGTPVSIVAGETVWTPASVGTGMNASACYVKYTNASLSNPMNGTNQTVIEPKIEAFTTGCSASGM